MSCERTTIQNGVGCGSRRVGMEMRSWDQNIRPKEARRGSHKRRHQGTNYFILRSLISTNRLNRHLVVLPDCPYGGASTISFRTVLIKAIFLARLIIGSKWIIPSPLVNIIRGNLGIEKTCIESYDRTEIDWRFNRVCCSRASRTPSCRESKFGEAEAPGVNQTALISDVKQWSKEQ